MAANTNTNPFLIDAARGAMATRTLKGQRPEAAKAFVDANGEDERANTVMEFGAGFIRRGLREQARYWAKSDEEVANVFWMLRDAIDESDSSVDEEMLSVDGASADEDEPVLANA